MRTPAGVRRRLSWKLFFSYVVVILVGALMLAVTAEFHAPMALARHIARMQALIGDDPALVADLYENFTTAVTEIVAVATAAAVAAAVLLSLFTARRIVEPVRAMMEASQRIAAGDYHHRVRVPGEDELARLASDFNAMAQRLELVEERRMALIGDVAHELRTPLGNIRGVMEGLIDGVLPTNVETFQRVQHEVARLQRLVQDLEELSRAEAGEIRLERRPAAVGELVLAAAQRLRPQFDDKGVELITEVAEGTPEVMVDAARITQVLLNLLGNALQYTSAGDRVWVRAWRDGRHVVVSVQDSGIGIAAEHLPHVFERFYRVDKSRSRAGGGTGIGLTIARYLTEAHGGRLQVASPGEGCGSTFAFTLPLVR